MSNPEEASLVSIFSVYLINYKILMDTSKILQTSDFLGLSFSLIPTMFYYILNENEYL